MPALILEVVKYGEHSFTVPTNKRIIVDRRKVLSGVMRVDGTEEFQFLSAKLSPRMAKSTKR